MSTTESTLRDDSLTRMWWLPLVQWTLVAFWLPARLVLPADLAAATLIMLPMTFMLGLLWVGSVVAMVRRVAPGSVLALTGFGAVSVALVIDGFVLLYAVAFALLSGSF